MTTTLAITNDQTYWSEHQIAALKQLGLSQASNGDLAVFFHQAQKTGLDPFSRQIYMINRGGKFGIQTSIDGFRIIAQRSNEYAGQAGPLWCGEDGVWKDVWLSKTPPSAAKVGVHRKGFAEALWSVATYESYAQPNNPIWKKMPELMLAKCAESLALRKAFPNDMSGIYTDEEMGQAEITNTISPKTKAEKVDLKVVKNPDPVETLTGEEWIVLLDKIDLAKTKDALKELWSTNSKHLDSVIPDTDITLRETILDAVADLG